MGKKKSHYVVKVGKNPGIYKTWAQCQEQVSGFPGAIFKGFETLEEAMEYQNEEVSQKQIQKQKEGYEKALLRKDKVKHKEDDVDKKNEDNVVAYVDGSYNIAKKMYSYGAVIFHNGKELHFYKSFKENKNTSLNNVAGEVEGAKKAMEYCLENNISSLDLYYDYQGIEDWCTGAWKAKLKFTKEYKEMYDDIKDILNINFNKVAAHTGNKYNELADRLANKAFEEVEIIEKECSKDKIISCSINNIDAKQYDGLVECLEKNKEIGKVETRETIDGDKKNTRCECGLELKYSGINKNILIEGTCTKALVIIMEYITKN